MLLTWWNNLEAHILPHYIYFIFLAFCKLLLSVLNFLCNIIYNRDCNTQIQILYLSIFFYAFKYIFLRRSQCASPDSQEGSVAQKRLTTPALWEYGRKWNDYNKKIPRNLMWKWRVNYADPIQNVMGSLASVLNLPHKVKNFLSTDRQLPAFQEALCNLIAHEMYFYYGR